MGGLGVGFFGFKEGWFYWGGGGWEIGRGRC
jgi:hypothetical protein